MVFGVDQMTRKTRLDGAEGVEGCTCVCDGEMVQSHLMKMAGAHGFDDDAGIAFRVHPWIVRE